MNPELKQSLKKVLLQHEGLKLQVYLDTVGKLTIGCGRNISDNGIRESEAMFMLDNDMEFFDQRLSELFKWYPLLDTPRRVVIASVAFNIGLKGIQGFKKMLAAMEKKDYVTAAKELVNSKAAQQTGKRYHELAEILRTGVLNG